MRNDDIEKMLNARDHLSRQLAPIYKFTETSSLIQSALKWQPDVISSEEFLRTALGPLEDIRRSGHMEIVSNLAFETLTLNNLLAVEQRFFLPDFSAATKLLDDYAKTIQLDVLTQYSQQVHDLQGVMECMRTPWLDEENEIQSLKGFAGLHGIGSVLRTLPPFETKLTDILRLDLGDWRKEIVWPSNISTDPIGRASLYVQQGFNPDLTTFPYPAFEAIVTETGLKGSEVLVAEEYARDGESDEIDREAAFERTNDAHDRLQRFEYQLRSFIDRHMKATFGPGWIKHQIPGDMRSRWQHRQDQDTGTHRWPLIAYADFTDYTIIITREDNWRDLFKTLFSNKSSIQESFRRLYPIRLATMHARFITQDDELYMYVETKRILSVIE